jgi:hypothetical protein
VLTRPFLRPRCLRRFTIRKKLDDPLLRKCSAVFREPIDFSVEGSVPKPRIFNETIRARVEENKEFILTPADWKTIDHIQAVIKGAYDASKEFDPNADDESAFIFDQEMVQEQEEERERQQEQEQEQVRPSGQPLSHRPVTSLSC